MNGIKQASSYSYQNYYQLASHKRCSNVSCSHVVLRGDTKLTNEKNDQLSTAVKLQPFVPNISFGEKQSIRCYLGMGTNGFFCQKSLADSTWRKQHRASSESANSSSLYLLLRIQKSEPRSWSPHTVWLSAIISAALCAAPLVALFSRLDNSFNPNSVGTDGVIDISWRHKQKHCCLNSKGTHARFPSSSGCNKRITHEIRV